jgi:hypothetical protein
MRDACKTVPLAGSISARPACLQLCQMLGDDAGLRPFHLVGADETPAHNARGVDQEDGGMRDVEALEAERVVDVIRLHHGAIAIAEHREWSGIARDEVRCVFGVLRVDGQNGGALIGQP